MAWLTENTSRPSLNTRRRSIEGSRRALNACGSGALNTSRDGWGKWERGGGLGRGGVQVARRVAVLFAGVE